jgi:hypothetical protein
MPEPYLVVLAGVIVMADYGIADKRLEMHIDTTYSRTSYRNL